ncbi:MAG: tetratricopeptide repeat protein [Bryobacterales bacterium]|nr:tetratricopeptide repeat protein [Bryobacterales bacterium]
MEHLKLLVLLYWRPGSAMSGILDRGSLLFASLLVAGVSLHPGLPFPFYLPLLALAAVYVPGLLLVGKISGNVHGSVSVIFSRDYSPLLTCTAMAFAAAGLPLLLLVRMLPLAWLLYVGMAALLYFAALMFFALRTVFGVGDAAAIVLVALSWIPLVGAASLWEPLQMLIGWIASPFFLLWAYWYLGRDLSNIGEGLRARQNFRRMLDAAALNPHDADAQVQLGNIYLQRRQVSEAVKRFQNALAIRADEIDAHFQLGRLDRKQGRLKEALSHFQVVMAQDQKHHQSEILRELGALYNEAKQYGDARTMLEAYRERRPYDPEGLYHLGIALETSGEKEKAREVYLQCVEAAQATPRYRRHETAEWSRKAQKRLS